MPALLIEDYPRFRWRAGHLDVCRHFMPEEFVKKYIALLALHKMNTFDWHLTEDQGWRIEIKQYPRLTEVGAWRRQTLVGRLTEDTTQWVFDGDRHRPLGAGSPRAIPNLVDASRRNRLGAGGAAEPQHWPEQVRVN